MFQSVKFGMGCGMVRAIAGYIVVPYGTVRGIHPGSALFSKESPGCQSDGVVEGIGFRWEIPGKD